MKFSNSPFLLTLALIVSSPLMSHASACSNSTIRGTYAFTIHGTIFLQGGSTLLLDGIAKETFDGKGNETQIDAVATNGMLTLGLVASLLLVGVALAAPVYRGSFTLPYDARWGQTTLSAGDYMIRFEDVGSRPNVCRTTRNVFRRRTEVSRATHVSSKNPSVPSAVNPYPVANLTFFP
jgi:hypothetical protein